MRHRVLFTSDIHGNEGQYRKLVNYAIRIRADSIVVSGDIAPLVSDKYLIKSQRRFLRDRLPELLNPLRKDLPDSRLFLMMGNEDCASNMDVLEREDPELFRMVHEKRIRLTEEFDIVGYPYVPITPFMLKDWEKYDLSETPRDLLETYTLRKATEYKLFGYKSTKTGWKRFRFDPEMEKIDSIQKDLSDDLFCENADKTVYVFHAPPYQTNLDLAYGRDHLGSIAIRLFIEKQQPYLTLHGHIHETVDLSGNFQQKIGKTLCFASGNYPSVPRLSVLVFDLYDLHTGTRNTI